MVASNFGLIKVIARDQQNKQFSIKSFFPNLQANINKTKQAFE